MTHAVYALILFTGWTFLLIVGVFLYRGVRFLGGTPITSWPRGSRSSLDPGFVSRLTDAHANCLENLPIFAVLVLSAVALNHTVATNQYAPYVFWARVVQSVVHVIGVSTPLVLLRATAWGVQLVCFGLMFASLLGS